MMGLGPCSEPAGLPHPESVTVTDSVSGHTAIADPPVTDLAEFLARHRASILRGWLTAVDHGAAPETSPSVGLQPGADDLFDGLTRAVGDGLVHDLDAAAGGAAER